MPLRGESTTIQVPERERILQRIHGIQRSLVQALYLRLISAVRPISILAIAVTVPPNRGRTTRRRRLVLALMKEPSFQRDRHSFDRLARSERTVRIRSSVYSGIVLRREREKRIKGGWIKELFQVRGALIIQQIDQEGTIFVILSSHLNWKFPVVNSACCFY